MIKPIQKICSRRFPDGTFCGRMENPQPDVPDDRCFECHDWEMRQIPITPDDHTHHAVRDIRGARMATTRGVRSVDK